MTTVQSPALREEARRKSVIDIMGRLRVIEQKLDKMLSYMEIDESDLPSFEEVMARALSEPALLHNLAKMNPLFDDDMRAKAEREYDVLANMAAARPFRGDGNVHDLKTQFTYGGD